MRASKDRILDAAEALFGTKGFASTSVREIVHAAGVKAPALYYHFGSKDGLLVDLLSLRMEELFPPLLTRLQATETLEDLFSTYAQQMLHNAQRRPAVMRFMFGVFTAPEDALPGEKIRPVQVQYFRPMLELVAARSPDATNQRRLFTFAMLDAMILGACVQFLSGWASALPDDLGPGIGSRAARMMTDDLPVPAFPSCEVFARLMQHADGARCPMAASAKELVNTLRKA
jgi:AcrR family transcriptional regulator